MMTSIYFMVKSVLENSFLFEVVFLNIEIPIYINYKIIKRNEKLEISLTFHFF